MAARLRLIQGGAGYRQLTLDDLIDEVTALDAEALELVEAALPLARQLAVLAAAIGPSSGLIGRDLVRLLERHERQHEPGRAA